MSEMRSAYVPPLQLTDGQSAPIAANGGVSYMSFERNGDAGTSVAIEDALKQIDSGVGQAVIDLIDNVVVVVGLLVLERFAVRVEHFEERHIAHGSLDFFYFRLHDFYSSYRCPYIRVLLLDPEHEPLPNIFRSYVVARRVVLHWYIF